MKNQKIVIEFIDKSGNKNVATVEGSTIKFGAFRISLGELLDIFTEAETTVYSNAIHNLVYGNAQLISDAINSGVEVTGNHLPNPDDFYYAKLLADAFNNMTVE